MLSTRPPHSSHVHSAAHAAAERRVAAIAAHIGINHTNSTSMRSMTSLSKRRMACASPTSGMSDHGAESPLGVPEDASAALSSRQIPLFQQGNNQLSKADPTESEQEKQRTGRKTGHRTGAHVGSRCGDGIATAQRS